MLRPHKWVQNGYTLCHTEENLPVFLHGALPGETVKARVIKATQSHAFALAEEIVGPVSNRIASDCPAYPECGGCSFRHVTYDEEVKIKLRLLRELKHVSVCAGDSEPELYTAPPDHYRNHVQMQTDSNRLGFYSLQTNQLVHIPPAGCRQLTEKLNKAVLNYKDSGTSGKVRFRETFEGLYLPEQITEGITIRERMERHAGARSDADHFEWEFPADGFFQVNRFLVSSWLDRILRWVPNTKADTIELFCGSGIIGGYCRNHLGRYTGYESSPRSLTAARNNFRSRSMQGSFHRGDIYHNLPPMNGYQLAIVNPPRTGLKDEIVQSMILSGIKTIIYSSCNAHTLNRDLAGLLRSDFKPAGMAVFDFFPRTPHVEVVVKLERVGKR